MSLECYYRGELERTRDELTAAKEEIETLRESLNETLVRKQEALKQLTAEPGKVEKKLREALKFFADMGWEYAKQALADTEEK